MEVNNSKQPLISVIVPVFNGQDYLKDCINSIEIQTYSNIEILIINDGSTDGTDLVCQQLKAQNSKIRLFYLDDQGVSAARNLGLQEAKGEYLTFVDADDRILPDMLELLYETLLSTNSDVTGCKFRCWNNPEEWHQIQNIPNNDKNNKDKQHIATNKVKTYDAQEYLKEEIMCGNSRCWSKLYKRSVLDGLKFRTNLTIGEDMLFLIDLLPKLTIITENDYQGYGYYQNPKGAMYRKFKPDYMDQITCWEIAREEIIKDNKSIEISATAKIMTAIMLTVGKLATLSKEERKQNQEYITVCHQKLLKEMQHKEVKKQLSVGYRLKIEMFKTVPQLYLSMYHFRKITH